MQSLPKVIFFDAVGTLFGVKGSVGQVYQAIALKYQVAADAEKLNHAFAQSFAQASPLAFAITNPELRLQQEFNWWKNLAVTTFTKAELLNEFTDFEAFFQELYVYFATEKPWFIYQDVIPNLQKWQQQKVTLGIISNFDSRIYSVLEALNLSSFFSSITISAQVGAAKPNSQIFTTALAKHNCLPEAAWHIGDSFSDDYQGAKALGINSFWLRRGYNTITKKNQLPNLNSLG
jgi:putative hydrolase of the HAD superfamily